MADISEVWTEICDAISESAAVQAVMGGTPNVIYSEGKVQKLPTYPAIRVSLTGSLPTPGDSGYGRFETSLQIDAFSTSKATNWNLLGIVAGLLDTPRSRPSGLSTAHFAVTEMIPGMVSPVGFIGIKSDSGAEIHQLAQDWSIRIVQTG